MSPLEKRLIHQAKLLAPHCNHGRRKHISFLVRRSKILSIGMNSRRTHTLAARFASRGFHTHSELSSIVNFPKHLDITRCTMYNVRIHETTGAAYIAIPCKSCQNLVGAFGIKRLLYTDRDGQFHVWKEGQMKYKVKDVVVIVRSNEPATIVSVEDGLYRVRPYSVNCTLLVDEKDIKLRSYY